MLRHWTRKDNPLICVWEGLTQTTAAHVHCTQLSGIQLWGQTDTRAVSYGFSVKAQSPDCTQLLAESRFSQQHKGEQSHELRSIFFLF